MRTKAKVSGLVVAGFPSPAEQYLDPPLNLKKLQDYFTRINRYWPPR